MIGIEIEKKNKDDGGEMGHRKGGVCMFWLDESTSGKV